MRKLLKNGHIVDVFLDSVSDADVLIENERIIGVGTFCDEEADEVIDIGGKFICPGFTDGHIHIESSMLSPAEFVRTCLPHGTTTVIADPHEIANVSGLSGIEYMLESTEGLPMNVFFMLPSCVPAAVFDESGAVLTSEDLAPLLSHPRVLGLGEMMDYPGVISGNEEIFRKIGDARAAGKIVNGHAPMLTGRDLDRYIAAGIFDDHECSSFDEALEKLRKGQWIMIRQGTAARNLEGLLDLFDEPYSRRCLLVTDDKHPADLIESGHIDNIIRMAAARGKSVITAIRMATLQAAQRYGLTDQGAIAPGYLADLLILDDLESVSIRDVYFRGEPVVRNGTAMPFPAREIREEVRRKVTGSFSLDRLTPDRFMVRPQSDRCRVICAVPNQLFTGEEIMTLDFSHGNGIDISRDVLKLAVVERHRNSGHIGLGYVKGMGLGRGAIASSVSHDAHNLIVLGADEEDMAAAANCVREMGGGLAVADHGQILAAMALPIGGLMGEESAAEMARQNVEVRKAAAGLGRSEGIDPFMHLAFVSLPVIPDLKMTTQGPVDVNRQQLVPLFV